MKFIKITFFNIHLKILLNKVIFKYLYHSKRKTFRMLFYNII